MLNLSLMLTQAPKIWSVFLWETIYIGKIFSVKAKGIL